MYPAVCMCSASKCRRRLFISSRSNHLRASVWAASYKRGACSRADRAASDFCERVHGARFWGIRCLDPVPTGPRNVMLIGSLRTLKGLSIHHFVLQAECSLVRHRLPAHSQPAVLWQQVQRQAQRRSHPASAQASIQDPQIEVFYRSRTLVLLRSGIVEASDAVCVATGSSFGVAASLSAAATPSLPSYTVPGSTALSAAAAPVVSMPAAGSVPTFGASSQSASAAAASSALFGSFASGAAALPAATGGTSSSSGAVKHV